MYNNYFWCNAINSKKIKITFFSNLPYSVFKTNTFFNHINSTIHIKKTKFKYKNTIVTLRAPKHFKVGRQHYSLGSRFSYFTLNNYNTKWYIFIKNSFLYNIVKHLTNLSIISLKQPISLLKTIHFQVAVKVKFNFN